MNLLTLSIIPQFLRFGEGKSAKNPNVAQHTLYDIRDNKPYTVRKLADGNCWMTDNLALELTAGTPVEGSLNTSATAYTFTPTSCATDGTCPMNGNTLTPAPNGNYYYSWYAATGGTGTLNTTTDSTGSICPVGWRLPATYSTSTTKSYGSLTNAYGLTSSGANNNQNHVAQLEGSPLNFVSSGYYAGGSLDTGGNYWSSTAYSNIAAYAYHFYFRSTDTGPQGPGNKYVGIAVRCVVL